MDLEKGCIYRVLKTVTNGDLRTGESWVYLGSASDYFVRDRYPEYLVRRTYYFYEPNTGATSSWVVDGKYEFQQEVLSKYLKEFGGWPRPKEGEVKGCEAGKGDISKGKDALLEFVPYFKSIIEGEPNVKNFFYWVEEQDELLSKILTGREKLDLRLNTFKSIKNLLDYFGISYTVHPRYQWTEKIIHNDI